jgi:alpha-L-rhamnosidase
MIMWATIDEFFYGDLAGIQGPEYYGSDVRACGFKEIRIAPFVPKDLDWARGSIRTAYGTIASSWKKTATGIELEVEIPVNTTAKVSVPKCGRQNVGVIERRDVVWQDGAYTEGVAGITGAAESDEFVTFDVGSGSYCFSLTA